MSIVGIGQIPITKANNKSLRHLGAKVAQQAMKDAGVDSIDAIYVGNMLSDELQSQKHIAALIADEAGLAGAEALQIRAATATGAAALRVAFLAVSSGAVDLVLVIGVEKMSTGIATPELTKALDAQREVRDGATLVSQNARLMQRYMNIYNPPDDAFAHFSVNAHDNAAKNPFALFNDRQYSIEQVMTSRIIVPPMKLLDCSPICDGAAAVLLAPSEMADRYCDLPVKILASTVATDRFRIDDRIDPLQLTGARQSISRALQQADIQLSDIDFFELHDAFSIMACLSLEAAGFADPGGGWQLAANGKIRLDGRIPIATMGGLKARGHPIGATAIYQTCETVLQLTGRAGENQLTNARVALMQSVGGVASTVITHILAA